MTVKQLLDNVSSYELELWAKYWKVRSVEAEMARNRSR